MAFRSGCLSENKGIVLIVLQNYSSLLTYELQVFTNVGIVPVLVCKQLIKAVITLKFLQCADGSGTGIPLDTCSIS